MLRQARIRVPPCLPVEPVVEGEWLLVEHSPSVAVQFADRYATAVAAQARRIQHPHDQFERVPDCFLQVNALHNVLRAAEMAKGAIASATAKRAIQEAISVFLGAVVVQRSGLAPHEALNLARNVLQHFDEFYCATSNRQGRQQQRNPKQSKESLARAHQVGFRAGAAGEPHLVIGDDLETPDVTIDLVAKAPGAARQLALAVGNAIGF